MYVIRRALHEVRKFNARAFPANRSFPVIKPAGLGLAQDTVCFFLVGLGQAPLSW